MSQGIIFISLAVAVAIIASTRSQSAFLSCSLLPPKLHHVILPDSLPQYALLELFAREAMDWERSTTAIPISRSSVLLKSVLSRDTDNLPDQLKPLAKLHTVRVQDVRSYLNKQRLSNLQALCAGATRAACIEQANVADPELGVTPLHIAYATGDQETIEWLRSALNASEELLDSAGRKPANLSFANFVQNSKRWATQAGRTQCDLPTVTIRSPSDFAEIRRLVAEGEPVLIKNALQHLINASSLLKLKLEEVVSEYGGARVRVGEVPYADYFALPNQDYTLAAYYRQHVLEPSPSPLYIFQKHEGITRAALNALDELVTRAFPSPSVICPLAHRNTGKDSIHFFLGSANSGAPFHIHADAINVITKGRKKWFIAPPIQALYSRKHIAQWLKEDYEAIAKEKRPLECVQEEGDIVYIPFDWGHATINLELTFGFALELLNRRELFMTLPSQYESC